MYRWVYPSPLNTAFLLRLPLHWPLRLGSSYPHIPKALIWNCGIFKNLTLINTNTIFFCSVPLNFIFSFGLKLSPTITSRSFCSVISPCFTFSAVASRPFFTSKPTVTLNVKPSIRRCILWFNSLLFVIQNNSHKYLYIAHVLNYKLNSLLTPFYKLQSFVFSSFEQRHNLPCPSSYAFLLHAHVGDRE